MSAAGPSLLSAHIRDKSFGDRTVLRNATVTLEAGEVLSLLGPSGCGKSTLLRILSGLDGQFDGEVLLDGAPLRSGSKDVGVVFQEPRLMPWLSVEDNVAFRTRKPARSDPHVAELLSEVGLRGRGGAWPKELSGGQAQRASIARGLYTKPRVLFLDEPFSAVDAFTRMHLQDLLAEVAEIHRLTIVLVTHDIDEALHLSDRVLVMDGSHGSFRMDIRLDQPRPRSRDVTRVAAMKAEIIGSLAHA